MNRNRLTALVAGLVLALATAACGDDNANTNTNANANRNANANTGSNANANANANANRSANYSNANMTREEYERNKEGYSEDARRLGSKVGTGANDGWLWTKVRMGLLAAADLRDSTINVDVDNAVVTLSGTVANGQQKVRAADVAKKTDGVKSVTNKLTLKSDGAGSNSNNSSGASKK